MPLIRPAQPADCQGLAEVQLHSYRTAYASAFPPDYFAHMTVEEQTADWHAWLTTYPDDILWVAEGADQTVAGYVLARAQPEIYPGYAAEVMALHVRATQQRHGLGRALLRQAALALTARGCASAMLWTLKGNPAQAWYERLHGQWLAEKSQLMGEHLVVEVAYGWPQLTALH